MHPNSWALTGPQMLKCWPFPAPASWTAPAATPILPRWTPPAPPVCQSALSPLRPALWPGEKTLRDTVMQFLPFADILVLTADEMELLLTSGSIRSGCLPCCGGIPSWWCLRQKRASTPLPGQYTHSCPSFPPRPKSWPHGCCIKSQQELTLKKLMKCSAPALQTLL